MASLSNTTNFAHQSPAKISGTAMLAPAEVQRCSIGNRRQVREKLHTVVDPGPTANDRTKRILLLARVTASRIPRTLLRFPFHHISSHRTRIAAAPIQHLDLRSTSSPRTSTVSTSLSSSSLQPSSSSPSNPEITPPSLHHNGATRFPLVNEISPPSPPSFC